MSYKITLRGTISAIQEQQADPQQRNPNVWVRFAKWRARVDGIPYMEAVKRYGTSGTPEDRLKYEKFKTSLKQGIHPDQNHQPPTDRGVTPPSGFEMSPVPNDRGVTPPSGFEISPVPNDRGVTPPSGFEMEPVPRPRVHTPAYKHEDHMPKPTNAVGRDKPQSLRKATRRAAGIPSAGLPVRRVAKKREKSK